MGAVSGDHMGKSAKRGGKAPKGPMVRIERTQHSNTYAALFHASDCVLKAGEAKREGSTWQFLASLILSAFTFEAYLNHIGAKLIPCWDQLERALSPWGKLALLCDRLNIPAPDQGKRPMSTVVTLYKFRSTMAHGKSQTLTENKIKPLAAHQKEDWSLDRMLRTEWEKKVRDAKFAKLARKDLAEVLEMLHEALPAPLGTDDPLFNMGFGHDSAEVVQ